MVLSDDRLHARPNDGSFLPAILAIVSPRYSSWSIAIGVIATILAPATVVASSLPPRPVSRIANLTPACLNANRAMAVMCSKNVGSASIFPQLTSLGSFSDLRSEFCKLDLRFLHRQFLLFELLR